MNITKNDVYEYFFVYQAPWCNLKKYEKEYYIDTISKIVITNKITIYYYKFQTEYIEINDYIKFLKIKRKNKLQKIL